MLEKFNTTHSLVGLAVVLLLIAVFVYLYNCYGCCKAKCDQCKGSYDLSTTLFAFAIFLLLVAIATK